MARKSATAARESPSTSTSKRCPPSNVEATPEKCIIVQFSVDTNSDAIKDVERIQQYRPSLEDIPEEDAEAHALLGKYSNLASVLGDRAQVTQSCGFQTPKKANQMFERTAQILQNSASKCASPIPSRLRGTPSGKSSKNSTPSTTPVKNGSATPTRSRKSSSASSTPRKTGTPAKSVATPLSRLKLKGDEPATPHATRRAFRNSLVKRRMETENESEGSSSEEGESESEEDEETSTPQKSVSRAAAIKNETPNKRTPSKRKKILSKDNHETYFLSHGDGKILTSDKTLNNLKTPRLSQEAIRHILSAEKLKFQSKIDELIENHRKLFPKWQLLMLENFNVLCYGLGSKRNILNEFRCKALPDENCIVINGYFPSLTLRQILNGITSDLMETKSSFSTPSEQVDFIFKNLRGHLYLVIHNIDGQMLRGNKNQSVIARLVSHPNVHLICSVDHINSSLMWDNHKMSQLNFVSFDVTTFLPYVEETLNENSLMVKQSGNLALSSLTRVFASLTPNAKGIYLIIVRYQIAAVKEAEESSELYSGISFKDLYRMCRKAFLVNADLTLRAQLTEFRDHKLIRSRKGSDGLEYLIIPLDNATLQEFLEQQTS